MVSSYDQSARVGFVFEYSLRLLFYVFRFFVKECALFVSKLGFCIQFHN